ncbi:limbic system-associated membrane protein-like [Daktulosphaira vitifoliae]|uniref:limbic system-associated membrane protein-like n=1 Tax=Daktulosphaira vitifoliae TaxID=58002 RepID=UPI0021A992D7|nr:limbic system-associated membrane protein-like [Daktulosphaira vitifoliae]
MYLLFPNLLLWMYVVLTWAEPPYINPYKDMDPQEMYPSMDPNKIPKFMTKPNTFRVVTKDTIVLPCEVYNPGNYVLAWKKGHAILTAGTTKVTPEERFRIVEGYNLEIRNVHISDAGNYICQIGTLEPLELKHSLQILIPPRMIGVTLNGKVSAKKGSHVALQCNSTGNPIPTITWSRKNNMLPSGEKTFTGDTYTIKSVRRHDDGIYICSASNNIGDAVTEQIDLNILYPPEVEEEQSVVFTVEGRETEIVCIVHAEPPAEVLWYRDTLQLDTTEWRIMEVRGNRYTLRLRKAQKIDFGNYSCVADNGLGKSRQFIELTGKPKAATFTSDERSRSKDSYNISWMVKSYSPIQEYKLLYRPIKNNSKSQQETQYKRPMRRRTDDWTEISVTPQRTDIVDQAMSQVITSLEPGTSYEATVQSRNRYGWSEISRPFTFTTLMKNDATTFNGNSVYIDPELRDMSVTTAINNAPKTIQTVLLCVMITAIIYLA